MRTVSLRRRVTLVALAVLALALVLFDAFLYISLDARLRADLRGRLTDRAALAGQLYPQSTGRQLADRLTGDGITATVSSEGQTVIGRPSALAAPPGPGGHPPKASGSRRRP